MEISSETFGLREALLEYNASSKMTSPSAADVFKAADADGDGFLDKSEFNHLMKATFANDSNVDNISSQFFKIFDDNQDGLVDPEEFQEAWSWSIEKVLCPSSALIVVDVQNDFLVGSLALKNCPAGQDGALVVPVINKMMEDLNFDLVVYSLDWHPRDHISFVTNASLYPCKEQEKVAVGSTVTFDMDTPQKQTLWPAHCVQGTWGAELYPNLTVNSNSIEIRKGVSSSVDSYSAFWDNSKRSQTKLYKELKKRRITHLYVCGVAYDVCVGYTCLDALDYGFSTVLVDDACKGVHVDGIESMKEKITKKGGLILSSHQVAQRMRSAQNSCDINTALSLARGLAAKRSA